jgi:hypothetical protein
MPAIYIATKLKMDKSFMLIAGELSAPSMLEGRSPRIANGNR